MGVHKAITNEITPDTVAEASEKCVAGERGKSL